MTEEQMDWIAARYEDCLCPACLGKIAIGELGTHPDPTGNRQAD
ncbi:MAG: hypothetical protein OJF51_004651 [Nitrospira sp.]|nr:MAG: hypothetical protein OJF51_004651 [Nitrospira sp.]